MSTSTIGLALGSGGARGLAHIPMLEVFDELGLRPDIIAGASIGAIIGAPYCAGISGKDLREYLLSQTRDRARAVARLVDARAAGIFDILKGEGNLFTLDGEKLLDIYWPDGIPETFEELQTPLLVATTDFFRREGVTFEKGPLRPAVAASLAIPGVVKPVQHEGRTLIDGGIVNPLPFDLLFDKADHIIAIDVAGGPTEDVERMPGGFELGIGTIQIMQEAIVRAKLASRSPEVVIKPDIAHFFVLEFFSAEDVLDAGDACKDAMKRKIESILRNK
jgi:NTE family protein